MSSSGRRPARKIIILGAAGRDFHNFNVVYRDNPGVQVVAFTAAQIPGIDGRRYPPELAGGLYPEGIPIVAEDDLEELCRRDGIDEVVFAYSDVTHEQVMHLASRALASGANYTLLGPRRTMLASNSPVIAVSALRTGCGKSAIARAISQHVRSRGLRAAALRHPMPYGDLVKQRLQRFASLADLDAASCTVEEREEYEPHIAAGNIVYAGVDYAAILAAAEAEAEVIVWDGGNNDFPFLAPDVHIVVADALRPDQVTTHHPGETVARMADVFVINKVGGARDEEIERLDASLRKVNPRATVLHADSKVTLDDAEAVRGRRVLVIEDGPTLTHGGMPHGAGQVAALAAGADIVDPRDSAVTAIRAVYAQYPHIGRVLPALGYAPAQIEALAATVRASAAELVVSATPIDLARLADFGKPVLRARYEHVDASFPGLAGTVDACLSRRGVNKR